MRKLRNPDTGETVSVSRAGAKVLLGRGYLAIGTSDGAPAEPSAPKPLETLKLAELLEHAETLGVDADTLEALRKPGTSKTQVVEAIRSKQ